MAALHFTENWNGALCNDSFAFIRPVSQHLYLHAELEVMIKDYFLGFAKIRAIKQVAFGEINDHAAFTIIGQDAGYLKTVLRKMSGTVLDSTPYCYGIAQYIQRNEATQAELFERRWKTVKAKSTRYNNMKIDEPAFATNTHWNGEEAYTH